jgi:CheY-like chemotaxis protein
MAHILIVEDEQSINDLIAMNLELVGHTSQQAFAGDEALGYIKQHTYSLIIMDIMLPGLDGFALMEHIPESTPVIFLTAMSNLADRVKGFKLGADDYIVKPFETIELLARIEAVLRRTHQVSHVFSLDNTVVNLESRTVTVDGNEIEHSTVGNAVEHYRIDVSSLEPMLAVPPAPTQVQTVKSLEGKKITAAIIGGCSAGRLEDMLVCASVLKDQTVHPDVTLIITPASSTIANTMDEMGLTSILRNSGAVIMPPGCGPCPGKHFGLLSPQDVAVTTTIRNSPGRMGSEEAEIYLASPLTVAHSALKGEITKPV